MQSAILVTEPQPVSTPTAVVTARNVVRRYGEGDTAVHALRGVSLDIKPAA